MKAAQLSLPTLCDKREEWIKAQGFSKRHAEVARRAYAAGVVDTLQHSTALKAAVTNITGSDLQLQTRPVDLCTRGAA